MDTDSNDTDVDAVSVASCKSNDITMIECAEQATGDETMELSPGGEAPQPVEGDDQDPAANVAEMTDDSAIGIEASQSLFESDSENGECDISQRDCMITGVRDETQPKAIVVDLVSLPPFIDLPEEQSLRDGAIGIITSPPNNKRLKQSKNEPLETIMERQTGIISDEEFAAKLCRMKTTDELIEFSAEQTQRVDQLMADLFSMR